MKPLVSVYKLQCIKQKEYFVLYIIYILVKLVLFFKPCDVDFCYKVCHVRSRGHVY